MIKHVYTTRGGRIATVTLNKWGNGQGILIPKDFCDFLGMRQGDKVVLKIEGQAIKVEPEKSYTLEALMAGYQGPKPGEYDWGKPMGKEMW